MVVFLVWLWLRHRDRYPFFRNMIVAFTGMALLVQMVAVAPPRLIGGTGLVDTAAVYGQSVYATFGDIADQYAAMPSIHVGWAVLIAFAVVSCSTSPWRWLVVAARRDHRVRRRGDGQPLLARRDRGDARCSSWPGSSPRAIERLRGAVAEARAGAGSDPAGRVLVMLVGFGRAVVQPHPLVPLRVGDRAR